jgi:hypothetical protein
MNNLPPTECQKHVDPARFTRDVWSLTLTVLAAVALSDAATNGRDLDHQR